MPRHSSRVCSIQSHRKIGDNFFVFFFWRITVPSNFLSFNPYPPLPKNNTTSKISRWKNDLELLSYFIFVRKACVFHAHLLNGHFFDWKFLFSDACACFSVYLKNQINNTSLARSPALAYAVRISQDGTRIKFEELMPVWLSNRCKFILVRPVFILYMILETVREDKAQRTRERRERAQNWPVEWKHDARIMMIAWLFLSEKRLRVV